MYLQKAHSLQNIKCYLKMAYFHQAYNFGGKLWKLLFKRVHISYVWQAHTSEEGVSLKDFSVTRAQVTCKVQQ